MSGVGLRWPTHLEGPWSGWSCTGQLAIPGQSGLWMAGACWGAGKWPCGISWHQGQEPPAGLSLVS